MRYGPARVASMRAFQLSWIKPSATSPSTASWTSDMALRQAAGSPSVQFATSARATSLGQTVAPKARAARSANVVSRASLVAILEAYATWKGPKTGVIGWQVGERSPEHPAHAAPR